MKHRRPSISEHLASLSVQYGIYPAELFQGLINARENKKAKIQDLTIEYRGNVGQEAIFLIKRENNALVQFRVDEETLRDKELTFDNWMENDKIKKQIAKQNPSGPISFSIKDLRHGLKKVNLDAKVLQVEEPRMVHTQFGNNALLANAMIEDETGKIRLCLWDQQVHSVSAGDVIQITNASVATFKGERQLRLGKNGCLTVTKQGAGSKAKQTDDGKTKVICA